MDVNDLDSDCEDGDNCPSRPKEPVVYRSYVTITLQIPEVETGFSVVSLDLLQLSIGLCMLSCFSQHKGIKIISYFIAIPHYQPCVNSEMNTRNQSVHIAIALLS